MDVFQFLMFNQDYFWFAIDHANPIEPKLIEGFLFLLDGHITDYTIIVYQNNYLKKNTCLFCIPKIC